MASVLSSSPKTQLAKVVYRSSALSAQGNMDSWTNVVEVRQTCISKVANVFF